MKRIFIMVFLFGISGCSQDRGNSFRSDFCERVSSKGILKAETRGSQIVGYCANLGGGSSRGVQNMRGSATMKTFDIPKQMMIRRASIRFEVKSYDSSRKKITDIIKAGNAYIASERESKNDCQISATVTIRVPESVFDSMIDSLVDQAKNLDERAVNVEDVTEEYIDTDSRLKAKREVEKRYAEILKKAQNVKEILEVEENLGNIREQIESAEGRLKYLSHQVSYSSIDLTYYEQKNVIPKQRVSGFSRTLLAFSEGWNGLIEFLIGMISLWPGICTIAAIAIVIIRIIQKKLRKIGKGV
jgi:hypothetical protein